MSSQTPGPSSTTSNNNPYMPPHGTDAYEAFTGIRLDGLKADTEIGVILTALKVIGIRTSDWPTTNPTTRNWQLTDYFMPILLRYGSVRFVDVYIAPARPNELALQVYYHTYTDANRAWNLHMTQYDLLDESGQVTYRGTLQVEPRFLKGYVFKTPHEARKMRPKQGIMYPTTSQISQTAKLDLPLVKIPTGVLPYITYFPGCEPRSNWAVTPFLPPPHHNRPSTLPKQAPKPSNPKLSINTTTAKTTTTKTTTKAQNPPPVKSEANFPTLPPKVNITPVKADHTNTPTNHHVPWVSPSTKILSSTPNPSIKPLPDYDVKPNETYTAHGRTWNGLHFTLPPYKDHAQPSPYDQLKEFIAKPYESHDSTWMTMADYDDLVGLEFDSRTCDFFYHHHTTADTAFDLSWTAPDQPAPAAGMRRLLMQTAPGTISLLQPDSHDLRQLDIDNPELSQNVVYALEQRSLELRWRKKYPDLPMHWGVDFDAWASIGLNRNYDDGFVPWTEEETTVDQSTTLPRHTGNPITYSTTTEEEDEEPLVGHIEEEEEWDEADWEV